MTKVKKSVSITAFFFSLRKQNMSDRATCWSVTINNPTKTDDDNIAMVKQKSGWAVYGQKEVGANGTEHYQLMVTTPQVRFTAVKKAFPRAHIEIARDRKALTKYVNKEETRTGALPTDTKYPSQQKLWDMFAEWLDDKGSWWDWDGEKALTQFDRFICAKIDEGYIVETIAVNPQTRSCVKNYFVPIIQRSNVRRQTDRQTDEKNVEVNDKDAELSCSSSGNEEGESCKEDGRDNEDATTCSSVETDSSVSESSCEESSE